MSLWTPGGEHPVDRSDERTPPTGEGIGGAEELGPEDRARAEAVAEEMAAVRQQLVEAPVAVVVANHAMGLYELAAIHLQQQPPNLAEAQVAIDAYTGLIEAVGDRMGPDGVTLRDALAQLRLAYVQIAGNAESGNAGSPSAAATDDDTDIG